MERIKQFIRDKWDTVERLNMVNSRRMREDIEWGEQYLRDEIIAKQSPQTNKDNNLQKSSVNPKQDECQKKSYLNTC